MVGSTAVVFGRTRAALVLVLLPSFGLGEGDNCR